MLEGPHWRQGGSPHGPPRRKKRRGGASGGGLQGAEGTGGLLCEHVVGVGVVLVVALVNVFAISLLCAYV